MFTYINREGSITENLNDTHIKKLTVETKTNKFFNKHSVLFPVYKIRDDGLYQVPRHWAYDNLNVSFESSDYGNSYRSNKMVFNGELKNDLQQEAALSCLYQLDAKGGGVLSLPTGAGKTVIALFIASVLRCKTLVIVHKQCLMQQWINRISQFLPDARIGILQQNKVELKYCDIAVGMLQSIATRDYDIDIFHDIGLVIIDEVHVIPTPVFSKVLLKLSVPYYLGLSATPERKDGLSKIIHWFIGPVCYKRTLINRHDVVVNIVYFTSFFNAPYGFINMPKTISLLCKMYSRNTLILDEINKLRYREYRVLVLSDRRNHCALLKKLLFDKYKISSALFIGRMKQEDLDHSITHDVLLATYGLAKEGLDIPEFDALVLATPRSDVVQACGRILHSKTVNNPVIIDLVDNWFIGHKQFKYRKEYYIKSGFQINLND